MRRLILLPFGALLLLALYWAQQQWRATRALDRGDAAASTRIWPQDAAAWRLAAQQFLLTDPAAAAGSARRAVADNSEDWRNWALLAQVQFETNDMDGARASMRQMSLRAMGYEAHWRYANLLLLTGDMDSFYTQAEQALAFAPGGDLDATLVEVWLATGENIAIFDAAVAAARERAVDPAQPAALAAGALGFLLDRGELGTAAPWWDTLVADPLRAPQIPAIRSLGAHYLGLLAEAGQPAAALAAFQKGVEHHVFAAADGPTSANLVTDSNFSAPPGAASAAGLGWTFCTSCGPWLSTGSGLTLEFQGDQADSVVLAHEPLLLAPATTYRLGFQSDGGDGISARIVTPASAAAFLTGTFTTDRVPAAYILQIVYQRPLGQTPLRGTIHVNAVHVNAVHVSAVSVAATTH